ncbi:hypothetical protein ABW636_20720 [Aquimarina sp. 2201CG1-2-11]|uniref:DUF6973 domain-containing protein n=1 Tax=Aquimarina discodermiae TaxID=3231043 RepID=UPI0034632CE3
MNLYRVIIGLSYQQIGRLSWVMLLNPICILPTLRATQSTMLICNKNYGKEHHGNGVANAYRHALWNMLLCYQVFIRTKNKEKAIKWAKTITDLYEKIAPNAPIENAMDLHNNNIGRMLFKAITKYTEEEVLVVLKNKVESAIEVTSIVTMKNHENQLVYLV